jgi:transposase
MAKKRLRPEERAHIIELRALGHTHTHIAETTGCDERTVYRTLSKWRKNHQLLDTKSPGRPRKLTDRDKRALGHLLDTGQYRTAADLHRHASESGITEVSVTTITSALTQMGRHAYKLQPKPHLTLAQQIKRLDWVTPRRGLGLDVWRRVVFTDEAYIYNWSYGTNRWTWLKRGAPFSEQHVVTTQKFGGGKIMLWGAISYNGIAAMRPVEGTLNGEGYLQILKEELPRIVEREFPHPRPPAGAPVFQQDNAPAHTYRKIEPYLKGQSTFGHMHWPPYSPDLSPIENFWPMFKEEVRKRGQTRNIDELWASIEATVEDFKKPEWVQKIRNMIDSMPRRVQAVFDCKGKQTRY